MTRKLILTSVSLQLVQIHAKLAKNKISDPKFSPKKILKRRKIKRPKLFETRFAEVSRQSEPSLTGKRPFKVHEMTVSGRTNGMTRRYQFEMEQGFVLNGTLMLKQHPSPIPEEKHCKPNYSQPPANAGLGPKWG